MPSETIHPALLDEKEHMGPLRGKNTRSGGAGDGMKSPAETDARRMPSQQSPSP